MAQAHAQSHTINELPYLVMGTLFGRAKRAPHWTIQSRFRDIYYIYVCRFVNGKPIQKYVCQECVGGITWPKNAHAQSQFGAVNRPVTPILLISTTC